MPPRGRRKREAAAEGEWTLEEFLTLPDGFGLTTATACQRAICKIADGRPLGRLAEDADVVAMLAPEELRVGALEAVREGLGERPAEMAIIGPIRSAKSLTAAAASVRSARTADLTSPMLKPGDVPRVSVVSTTTDGAKAVFGHIRESMLASPVMREWLLKEPTKDTVTMAHASGRPVEIKVVAGSRAGATLVSRWSVGVVFDEAARMLGQDEGVVNLSDARHSVLGRMLGGSQIFYITSPWAPKGPIYEMAGRHWGKPSKQMVLLRCRGPAMNPVWWTPEKIEALKAADADAFKTECEGEFADAETSMFPFVLLEAATRKEPLELPPETGREYVAAMDPGTRGNSWTLVVATRAQGKRVVAMARQWTGSRQDPLSPQKVLTETKEILAPYGVTVIETDQFAVDALRDIARPLGLALSLKAATKVSNVEMYTSLLARLQDGLIELPPVPAVHADLVAVKKVTTNGATGSFRIDLPRSGGGRHCDYAPSIARALARWVDEEVDTPSVETRWQREERLVREAVLKGRSGDREYWEPVAWAEDDLADLGVWS